MSQKELMESILPQLKCGNARIVTRSFIKKGDGKMFARLNGGRKKSDPENEWFGRVELQRSFGGCLIGSDYSSHVSGAAVRSGAADKKSEVEVETAKSWHKFANRFFQTDKATESKYYLKVQTSRSTIANNPFTAITETYIIDGKEYTRKQAEEVLKGYLKPLEHSKPTSTQINAGVDSDNEVLYFLPNIEDIVEIQQGNYHYTRQ